LVRSDVHVFYFTWLKNRKVSSLTGSNLIFSKVSFVIQWDIRLGDLCLILFLCTKECIILKVYSTLFYLAVRSLDKAHLIDLGVYAKSRDKTDVWSFRSLDGTKTAIVAIVYVT